MTKSNGVIYKIHVFCTRVNIIYRDTLRAWYRGLLMDQAIRRKIVNHQQAEKLHRDLYQYREFLEELNYDYRMMYSMSVRGDFFFTILLRKACTAATGKVERGWAKYDAALASNEVQQSASAELDRRLTKRDPDAHEYVVFTYSEHHIVDEAIVVMCSPQASNGFGQHKHNGRNLARAKRFVYEAIFEDLGERYVSAAVPEPLGHCRELFLKLCEDSRMHLTDIYAASEALTT